MILLKYALGAIWNSMVLLQYAFRDSQELHDIVRVCLWGRQQLLHEIVKVWLRGGQELYGFAKYAFSGSPQ